MLAVTSDQVNAGATVVFGVSTAVLSILTYRLSKRAHVAESRLQELNIEAVSLDLKSKAAHLGAAQLALLQVHLENAGHRTFSLVVANRGEHEAIEVKIAASHRFGTRALVDFAVISPGTEQRHGFTNHDWEVLGGISLALEMEWQDGAGSHGQQLVANLKA
jgi:hypothetical protein